MGTKGPSVLQRLFPEKEIMYNDVVIKVKAARGARVADFLEVFVAAGGQFTHGNYKGLTEETCPALFRILNECVKIPEDPSVKVDQLPLDVLEQVVDIVKDLSLPEGNLLDLLRIFGLVKRVPITEQASSSETESAK